MISYELKRSLRRSLSLQIQPNGDILVKAPLFLPQFEIDRFVKSKEIWIDKTLQKIQKHGMHAPLQKHTYQVGDSFYYLGNQYSLKFSNEYKQKLQFEQAFIVPDVIAKKGKTAIKLAITKWYKNIARDLFEQRLMIFSTNNALKYNEFRLTSAKTRWGSCTSQNNIRLNWKLLMAPIEVLDYVVIHELCHTVHHNHSKSFWDLVISIEPNYKIHRKWLKENGHNLVV